MRDENIREGKILHHVCTTVDSDGVVKAEYIHLTVISRRYALKGLMAECKRKVPITSYVFYGVGHPDNGSMANYDFSMYVTPYLCLDKSFFTPSAAFRYIERLNSQNLTNDEKEVVANQIRIMNRKHRGWR